MLLFCQDNASTHKPSHCVLSVDEQKCVSMFSTIHRTFQTFARSTSVVFPPDDEAETSRAEVLNGYKACKQL